jgi:hypothetical protein
MSFELCTLTARYENGCNAPGQTSWAANPHHPTATTTDPTPTKETRYIDPNPDGPRQDPNSDSNGIYDRETGHWVFPESDRHVFRDTASPPPRTDRSDRDFSKPSAAEERARYTAWLNPTPVKHPGMNMDQGQTRRSMLRAEELVSAKDRLEARARKTARAMNESRSAQSVQKSVSHAHLSDCASNYLTSVLDPFHPTEACLPLPPCFPSQSNCAFVRTTATCAATGNVLVMMDPFLLIASDTNGLYATTSSATQTDFTIGANFTTRLATNAPYTSAIYANKSYRLVSAGLRWRYAGTEMDLGGTTYGAFTPYLTLASAGFAQIQGNPAGSPHAVSREWSSLLWTPNAPNDFAFVTTLPASRTALYSLGVIIVPPDATSTPSIIVEAWVNWEVVGYAVLNLTPRVADPAGASSVLSTLGSVVYGVMDNPRAHLKMIEDVYKKAQAASAMLTGGSMAGMAMHTVARAIGWRDEL